MSRKLVSHGHVAYQIKENDACSNMVVHILPIDSPTLGLGQKAKIQLLSEYGHVAYHLKGQRAGKYSVFIQHLTPEVGKRSKHFFSESSHVAYCQGIYIRCICLACPLFCKETHPILGILVIVSFLCFLFDFCLFVLNNQYCDKCMLPW